MFPLTACMMSSCVNRGHRKYTLGERVLLPGPNVLSQQFPPRQGLFLPSGSCSTKKQATAPPTSTFSQEPLWTSDKTTPCQQLSKTSIPVFLNICLTPLCFKEKSALVSIFANWKKSREDFHFLKERQKAPSVQCLFCSKPLPRQRPPAAATVALPRSFPGKHAWHNGIEPPHLWPVSASTCALSLFCASVSITCPKVPKTPNRSYFGSLEVLKISPIYTNSNHFFTWVHFGLQNVS